MGHVSGVYISRWVASRLWDQVKIEVDAVKQIIKEEYNKNRDNIVPVLEQGQHVARGVQNIVSKWIRGDPEPNQPPLVAPTQYAPHPLPATAPMSDIDKVTFCVFSFVFFVVSMHFICLLAHGKNFQRHASSFLSFLILPLILAFFVDGPILLSMGDLSSDARVQLVIVPYITFFIYGYGMRVVPCYIKFQRQNRTNAFSRCISVGLYYLLFLICVMHLTHEVAVLIEEPYAWHTANLFFMFFGYMACEDDERRHTRLLGY